MNEYLAFYEEQLTHQVEHGSAMPDWNGRYQPSEHCISCLLEHVRDGDGDSKHHAVKQRFAWAIPNDAAVEAIVQYSPGGVVEIGAGGGYWAKMLREADVDVVAYDPSPPSEGESGWHDGHAWSPVSKGDHTIVSEHSDRTLLMVWPSYELSWAAEALDLFKGQTVVYVGEGDGGCTGDDKMHALLDDLFKEVESVDIPQWFGLHDQLRVFLRREEPRPVPTEEDRG